ncbi:hypothetical protein [Companilactobacillus nuruki]|uniref:Uncharacterized protein n=1 Tax=Companilactobacillus nuruki TaxID=1993540 RepID=A0A2N7AVU0_9LACO|nr:hypothetical protein [Companilactobacillus nuruki]PMD72253.1 hypothetical protein CBP76_03710 [Companilactobacillus nuruki]
MDYAAELALSITSIVIATVLIIGVILITIALFRINGTLKLRNKMLIQATHPYIFCQRNQHQNRLEIRNNGQVPIAIDKVDSILDLSELEQNSLQPGQIFFHKLNDDRPFVISINYHDDIDSYQSTFNI